MMGALATSYARTAVRGRPRPPLSDIDFQHINDAARTALPSLLGRWLPGGHVCGREYVVRNPRRADRRPGSFRINTATGRWSDFATGDKGGDPISLAAYLAGISQAEAARRLAEMFGIEARRHGR
jgi:hypothetical protein